MALFDEEEKTQKEKDDRIFLNEEDEEKKEDDDEDDRISLSELFQKLRGEEKNKRREMLGTDELGVLD